MSFTQAPNIPPVNLVPVSNVAMVVGPNVLGANYRITEQSEGRITEQGEVIELE
jgi:hypothetical protein